MIEFTRAFKTASGVYGTLEEAQLAELAVLFKDAESVGVNPESVAQLVLDNTDQIVNILTTTKDSRPKARKENGGTKKRRKKDSLTAVAAEASA
jgi:hypothetical protein